MMRFRSSKKKKGKNPFEASMIIEDSDVKVVTASYKTEPFFVGIGVSKQRAVKGSGQANLSDGVKGEYQTQKDLDWKLLYNPNALPNGFIPMDKTRELIAGTVAATSGSVAVFDSSTQYMESAPKSITAAQNALSQGLLTGAKLSAYLSKQGFEIDHETPISKGGTNNGENLRIVKREENRRRHE